MMVSTVKRFFKTFSGSLILDDLNLERSSVAAEVEAATVDTGVADRDNHLRSSGFSDVAKYPKLIFRSRAVETAEATSVGPSGI